MKFPPMTRLLFATLLALSIPSYAADTDLFAGLTPDGSDAPQVLFVLDNAANFSANVADMRCSITDAGVVKTDGTGTAPTNLDGTAGAVEQCAIYSAISGLSASTPSKLHIGIMGFNANGMKQFNPGSDSFSSSCVGGTGGCLLMPIVPFNATNKTNMLEWIRLWAVSGNNDYNIKGNNSANGAVMQEAWAYYFGKTGVSGRTYLEDMPTAGCASKNIIFVGNAYRNNATPGDGTNENNSPLKPLNGTSTTVGKNASPAATAAQKAIITGSIKTSCSANNTTLESAEVAGVYALNWALYMKAQGVKTFSIGVLGPTCNAEYAAHLEKLGSTNVGGGKFFATNNFAELKAAIETALSEIQSVNSVFAAVSLPVSVNTQGSYLNQVFVGMFRPRENFLPQWNGNLKQYKLGMISNSLKLVDASGTQSAINTTTGFIAECARSFWTPTTVDSYWALLPTEGCLSVVGASASNYPDGNVVEKGAQAFNLRAVAPTARTVKTCSPVFANCTAMTAFDTSNAAITQTLLNSGGADRDTLINWARGANNNASDNPLSMAATVMRSTAHGDVVHSRPVAINHGTDASPSVVVYYGANDGLLRAVNGNQTADITSGGVTYTAGTEMWSFMPPQFYSKIKRLRDNSVAVSYPTSIVATAKPKDYGMDGPITAFKGLVGGTTKDIVYATMRRGGRVLYAFDTTIPGSPALLWSKGCPNLTVDTDCSTDYTGIGQTWSSLKSLYALGYASGVAGTEKPMLIMGGGYDDCEDFDAGTVGGKNHNCSTTKGNKVYILDAATGNVVKAFDTQRAVVADATIVRDSAGMAKYAYTADLGGNVYRITFGSGVFSTWTMTKIASLGCDTPAVCDGTVPNRKFMFAPSVVTTDNVTYNVLLGSGDREKPVKEYISSKSVTNHFFMFKDKPSDAGWLTSENSNCGSDVICRSSLEAILTSATPSDAALTTKKGWYLGLTSTEQVVTSSVTVFGVVTFSTHQPAVVVPGACTNNLGSTRVYNVNYLNAESANGGDLRFEPVVGGGLPPSPVAGRVKIDGVLLPFCIGCKGDSPLESTDVTPLTSVIQPKSRIYWYLQK